MKGLDFESFKELASKKYNGKFEYEPFEGTVTSNSEIRYTCPIHGQQTTLVKYHLDKKRVSGCYPCSRLLAAKNTTKTTQEFLQEAHERHGSKFDLSGFKYIGGKIKGTVRCTDCGTSWECTPNNLLTKPPKTGCPGCRVNAIYTPEYYRAHGVEDHPCNLYVVKFDDRAGEVFIKVGLTKHEDIRYRFRGLHDAYEISILYQENSYFFEAYDKEQKIHSDLGEYKYEPKAAFKGHTECFSLNCLQKLQSSLGVTLE